MKNNTDSELVVLVNIVNFTRIEIPITLTVPGAVISGNLIPHSEWLHRNAKLILSQVPGLQDYAVARTEAAESIREQINSLINKPVSILEDSKEANLDEYGVVDLTHPDFIHLENVSYLVSEKPIPDGKRYLWRGKISSVSGWAYGSFSPVS